MLFQPLNVFFTARKIGFIAYKDLRTVCQIGVVSELIINLIKVFYRISAFHAGRIYQMKKQTCAVHMAEKIVTKPGAV